MIKSLISKLSHQLLGYRSRNELLQRHKLPRAWILIWLLHHHQRLRFIIRNLRYRLLTLILSYLLPQLLSPLLQLKMGRIPRLSQPNKYSNLTHYQIPTQQIFEPNPLPNSDPLPQTQTNQNSQTSELETANLTYQNQTATTAPPPQQNLNPNTVPSPP